MSTATVLEFAEWSARRRRQEALITDWNCRATLLLNAGRHHPSPCRQPPCLTDVTWHFDINPLACRYSVTIQRDGWPPTELRSGWDPSESPEVTLRREAQMDLLVQVLSASFGIPA